METIPSPTVGVVNQHSILNKHSHSKPGISKPPSSPSNLPTISVTKVPAPLPVMLPTASDIVPSPSPPTSKHSSLDLESGRIDTMREPTEDVGLVTSTRKTGRVISPLRQDSLEAAGSAIPILSIPPPSITSTTTSPTTFTPDSPALQDLLADSVPGVEKEPIEPSPLTSEATHPPPEPDPSSDDPVVDTTVRLVGGGGQAGVTESPIPPLPEEQPPTDAEKDADTVPIHSSETVSKPDEKSHKKSKSSLASLKKLGQFGRTIKRDSVSSVKSIISPR